MANTARVPVPHGATPTKIDVTGAHGSDTLVITNTGTVDVQLGGENVTTSNGWRGLIVGATLVLDVNEPLYVIVAGGTDGALDVLRVK